MKGFAPPSAREGFTKQGDGHPVEPEDHGFNRLLPFVGLVFAVLRERRKSP